jgi:hypothetical protein
MTRCFLAFSPAFLSSFSSKIYLWCLQAQTRNEHDSHHQHSVEGCLAAVA